MIESAEEFVALCESQDPEAITRSMRDTAHLAVWMEVINRYRERHLDVAQNQSVPVEILRILARVENPTVRAVVAEKRRIPKDLFQMLATDSDPLVRQRIAGNSKTPTEILDQLANDLDENVSRVAKYKREIRSG